MVVQLSDGEKTIIRKIAQLQLVSLNNILNKDIEEDILIFCIQKEIFEKDLMEAVEDNMEIFEDVLDCPERFFLLDEDNMRISKHLLLRYFRKKKYSKARRGVFRKICLIEQINLCLN